MQICPSLSEINAALRAVMVETVKPFSSHIIIVPEVQEADPDTAKILILQSFKPEIVSGAELGGRAGHSRRGGNYLITLSVPKGDKVKMDQAWAISGDLEANFRMLELSSPNGAMFWTDDPYISNSGITPDNRMSLLVTVPWVAWTGGEGA